MLKRITAVFCCLIMIFTVLPVSGAKASENGAGTDASLLSEAELSENERLGWGIDYVKATFLGETVDVLQEVMEIDGGMAEPIRFELEYTRYVDLSFGLMQLMEDGKTKELLKTPSSSFSINADELAVGCPLYLVVFSGEDGSVLGNKPLGIRINKGLMASRVPDTLSHEFQSGLKVDMSTLLPGMELNVLPFLIPVTVKTYSDGAVRVGIGVNASDVDF